MDSFLNYLDKIRQKPEADRKRIAIFLTFSVTFLVVGLWVVNIIYFLPNPLVVQPAGEVPSNQEATESPIGFIQSQTNRISDGFQVVVDKVSGLVK